MKKNLTLISFILVWVLLPRVSLAATDCNIQTEIPATECHALIALYDSTDGANWKNKTGWKVTNTPCSWYEVTCGGGHVTGLYLYDNQLSGSIPVELGNLGNLTGLEIGSNQLSGTIPVELGNLVKLIRLYLNNNQLSGTIPDLSSLTALVNTDLGYNKLTGETAGSATAKDSDWAATQTVPPHQSHGHGIIR